MKKLHFASLFIVSFVLIAIIAMCVYFQDKDCISTILFSCVANDDVTEKISLYYDGEQYYAFLPSYADFSTMHIEYNAGYSLYIDGELYNSSSDCASLEANRHYSVIMKNELGITLSVGSLVIMRANNIATLSVHLIDGTIADIHANKEISKSGYASLIKADKTVDYFGNIKELHGRGNSTWNQEKKSYAIEFTQETDLLGMGKGKGWVLLSNSFDESGLRNKLAFDTANDIGLKNAVDSEYVDLYIDNEYFGLYLLAERIEVGENRVNIYNLSDLTRAINYYPLYSFPQFKTTENNKARKGYHIPNNPDDITGGYILQIEPIIDRIDNKECYIQTEDLTFSLAHPKYATKEQIDYISDYLNSLEREIKDNNLSGIDVDSFVKYYLIQELFANTDTFSDRFFKNTDILDDKLYACSVWDFDLSIGNAWLVSDMNPRALYRNTGNWFDFLYDNESFVNLLKQYYRDRVKPNLDNYIFDRLFEYKKIINQSFFMNKIRWNYSYNLNTSADKSQNRYDNLDEHLEYIVDFMKERIRFFDTLWIDNEEYYYVTFSSNEIENFIKKYSIKHGESFNENPVPKLQDTNEYIFLGWFDKNDNKYVPGRIIAQNETYTAKWEAVDTENSIVEKLMSLIDRIKIHLFGEKIYLYTGLAIIGMAIVVFFIFDLRQVMRTRRYRNGRK